MLRFHLKWLIADGGIPCGTIDVVVDDVADDGWWMMDDNVDGDDGDDDDEVIIHFHPTIDAIFLNMHF